MGQIIEMESEEERNQRIMNILYSVKPRTKVTLHPETKPKPKKKKYKQKWSAYDKAKTNEDYLFKKILQELLAVTCPPKGQKGRGRPGYPTQDKIFCMALKTFYKSDLRKTVSILRQYLHKAPCYKTICNFYNDISITPILDKLILLSSMPLSQLEDTCAIDSTGFSTSRFERWHNFKWKRQGGKQRTWKKAHAVIGCKTNTFISVEVTEKNIGDSSMFKKTVADNLQPFSFSKFTADKAYLTRDILNFLSELEIIPLIPFKKNSKGNPRGSKIWSIMFSMFVKHNDKYMDMYHQRSNIETGFHMIKQRFGDYLLTRTHEANVNEIKMKFLCHNTCVLIQELFESNIKIEF